MNQSYVKTDLSSTLIKPIYLLLFIFLGSVTSGFAQQTVPQSDEYILMEAPEMGEICKLPPTDINRNYFKKAEENLNREVSKARASNFEITYINSCQNGSQWPQDAKVAFEYGMGIWENYLESDIPIRVRASWIPRDGNVLGSAGPTLVATPSNGVSNTWYTIAQASAMTGVDQLENNQFDEDHDININMNCNFDDWYFGTDAKTPVGKIDFVTVVLHEIGHGIGFIGTMGVDDGSQTGEFGLGEDNFPFIYDRFTEDGGGTSLLTLPNPSAELYEALTGRRGGVYFNGENATGIYNDQLVPLYSPSEWNGGSSYSHLDQDIFSGQENLGSALMRPRIDRQFSVHSPGPVFCAMLEDWGWPISVNCQDIVESDSQIAISEEDIEFNGSTYEYNFGINDVGDRLEYTFQVFNNASSNDSLSYVLSLAGDETNYRLSENSNYNNKIAPNESEEITIIYEPIDDGAHQIDLNFYHNSAGISNPLILNITGEAYYDNFIVIRSEEIIDYRATNIGSPVERQFEIENLDEANSDLDYEVEIKDPNFRVSSGNSMGTLEPGDINIITVLFDPRVDDMLETKAVIYHNSGNLPNPFEITLTGESLRENEVARLEDNYPNPFNPTTTIPYVLPEASDVRLDIYNVSGQLVQTLVNSQQPEGRYNQPFEAGGLASGMYFYRLIVNDNVFVKRLLLVK